ncbi:conserved exported protein of unknown function [Agreia sp. COWG]|nr:conserved exported protein of unknown function [Agreia sp. COWG]
MLAGGLVLGVGGSLTMAAWADSEAGQATFTASRFATESSINSGTAWVDSSATAPLTFAFPAGGLSPSTVKYAPFWVRTKALSLDGTLALQAATTNNATFANSLKYRAVRYTGATCDASAFTAGATYLAGTSGTPATNGIVVTAAPTTTPASTITVAANQTQATQFCFEVSMNADASTDLQGQSITVTWEVRATSSS